MAEVQTSTQSGELSQRFIEFVMMHAQNAALFLGQIPNPKTGEGEVNLELAKMFIDQLAMIQEKTRGNLTSEESTVLRNALSNLQMAYVEVAREPGRARPEPAGPVEGAPHRRPSKPRRHQNPAEQPPTRRARAISTNQFDRTRDGVEEEIHEKLRPVNYQLAVIPSVARDLTLEAGNTQTSQRGESALGEILHSVQDDRALMLRAGCSRGRVTPARSHGAFRRDFHVHNGIRSKDSVQTLLDLRARHRAAHQAGASTLSR